MISADSLVRQFQRDGYAIIEDLYSPAEIEALRREAVRICRGELGQFRGLVPTQPGDTDDEVIQRHLCIHFPHKISELVRGQMAHPRLVQALTEIIGPNVKSMQSMLFIKGSGKPGQAWHQDEYFIPTRDRSLTAAWIALDDATTENGCLWVLPGSHGGVLWPQRDHGDDRFDCSGESYNFPYRDEDAVAVELKAGSAVLFNGYLLHRSLPNVTRSGFRRALALHYMSADSLLPWILPEGEGVGPGDYRDIVMVAGHDPYAWKGLEERAEPHVRPSGEGGCGTPEQNVANLETPPPSR